MMMMILINDTCCLNKQWLFQITSLSEANCTVTVTNQISSALGVHTSFWKSPDWKLEPVVPTEYPLDVAEVWAFTN